MGVEESSIPVHGMTTMDIQLQGQTVTIDFIVVDMPKVGSLMGLDFLERYNCVIDLSEKVMQFRGVQVPLSKENDNNRGLIKRSVWSSQCVLAGNGDNSTLK